MALPSSRKNHGDDMIVAIVKRFIYCYTLMEQKRVRGLREAAGAISGP